MKNKKYLILYYICCVIMFVLTPILQSICKFDVFDGLLLYSSDMIMVIINVMFIIVVTIFALKRKIAENNSLVFPISFILFYAIVLGLCFLFNNKVAIEYAHFNYYLRFVLLYFTMFNIYSMLSIDFKKKGDRANRK